MSASEFKAWLDGFMESRDRLTKKDCERIKDMASRVAGPAYVYPVYPYYPSYVPYFTWQQPIKTFTGGVAGGVSVSGGALSSAQTVTTSTAGEPYMIKGAH